MAFDPISAALDIGGKIIDRVWPDPTQANQAKLELMKMTQTGELAQLTADTDLAKAQAAINQAEAGNNSVLVAGWRPFIGWVCGGTLAFNYVLAPLITWTGNLMGHAPAVPTLDFGQMLPILLGMLGLGAMRTTEKINGVSTGH